jgi:hypothetical protein
MVEARRVSEEKRIWIFNFNNYSLAYASDFRFVLANATGSHPVAITICGWLPSGSQNGISAMASLIRRTTSSSLG